MKALLGELAQGREIIHVLCEANAKDMLAYNLKKTDNLQRRKTPVLCVSTGISYDSVGEASKATAVAPGAISRCINNKQKTANGLLFKKETNV